MKTIFTVFIITYLISSSIVFPQNKIKEIQNGFSVEIDFNEAKFVDTKNNFLILRNYFEFTDPSLPGSFKLPVQTLLIAIPANSRPEIILSNKEEESISNVIPALQPIVDRINDSTLVNVVVDFNEAKYDLLQKNDIEIIGYTWQRENYCAVIKINTHRFDLNKNQITRIKKANIDVILNSNQQIDFSRIEAPLINDNSSIIINNNIANQFAAQQPLLLQDTTGNWINYGSEYLKIGTAKDALFRITRTDLEAKGINVNSINPKSFRLIESGVEVPITVVGQDDNSFDASDYIQFYGTLNYPKISHRIINAPNEQYNEYLNRYSDTTFFFLTWGQSDGKRIQTQNTFNSGLSDSLTYYKYFEHTESNRLFQNCYTDEVENQTPGWLRNKTWYFLQTVWLYSNTTRNYNFNVADVYPNKTAKFYYKAVSFGSSIINNAHQLTLKVNSTLIDSQSINRNDQVLLSGTFNTNQFITNPNILSVKNYPNSGSSNTVVPDWYDIEYPKYLKLNSNFLLFTISDDITNGQKIVKIQNATTSNYEIYKVKPFLKKIENYQVISNQLIFTDTINIGDQYVVSSSSSIGDPVYYYKKQFANLRSITNQSDYLAITHPNFIQSANNYVNYVATIYGVTKDLISIEDIYDEFSFGYPQPEAIRLFANVTYTNRQNPKPKYLTLIGDANYDYKLYRFKGDGVKGGGNFVPSYGNPVSDNWFAVWDESTVPLPQLRVGRIPINSSEDLDFYLSKVQNNFTEKFDEWNKRYIFFSGGRADYPDELAQLKSVNDQIIFNHVKPAPLSGSAVHFYKTTNPLSDFGPYTPEFISNTLDDGGVFISYLGHSGTATWDNSISETTQLKNDVNKNPLITDFGCSTNKFAEPDIVSFGERFLLNDDGQAIGYIGNSSLGFTSTSLTIPIYFYEIMLKSNSKEIGESHLSAKDSMFAKIGSSSVFRLFALTNTLIGDPLVRIKIPTQSNLKISEKDLLFQTSVINDNQDSVGLKIVINNYGIKDTTNFNYTIEHKFNGSIIKTISGRLELPVFKDTISVWLTTQDLAGEHSLTVNLDTNQEVTEIYEDDNLLNSTFYVYSTALRDMVKQRIENPALNKIRILNPSLMGDQSFNIKIQISETEDFNSFQEYTIPSDSFYTDYNFPQLTTDKRYWFRYSTDQSDAINSESKSFINNSGQNYYMSDSVGFNPLYLDHLSFKDSGIIISDKLVDISITSAGFEAGATCVISKNGFNLLTNTFFAGMGIVVFDPLTFEVDTSAWYQLFNQPGNMTQLVALINSISDGKIVAMGVSSDAANNITTALKDAIKTLGSTKIDNIAYRSSWALIGKKGAVAGNVLEEVRGRYDGLIYIDSTFVVKQTEGNLLTSEIGPSTDWQDFKVVQNTPTGTSINHYLYGIKNDLSVDSLGKLTLTNSTSDLSFINPKLYPKIKVKSEFNASPEGTSPELSSLGVDYTGLPELGFNYQVVSTNRDTLVTGYNLNLKFFVYNVGESVADSFKVNVVVTAPQNTFVTLLDTLINNLLPEDKILFDLNYTVTEVINPASIIINVDAENKVTEYYEDNNFFTKYFYVQSDVVPPTIKVTFDDAEVVNGDFVSDNPNIKITVNDDSAFPITDPNLVRVFLNLDEVNRQEIIDSSFGQDQSLYFKPILENGSYLFTVVAEDNGGNTDTSEIYFEVSSDTKLHQVYNYPNPFANETYFTFRLSQIPEEVRIKIFTISGRLIQEITKKSSELNYDLNKILWDGKDKDGDIIANGTYLYKVILKNDEKVESVTQKLVILK